MSRVRSYVNGASPVQRPQERSSTKTEPSSTRGDRHVGSDGLVGDLSVRASTAADDPPTARKWPVAERRGRGVSRGRRRARRRPATQGSTEELRVPVSHGRQSVLGLAVPNDIVGGAVDHSMRSEDRTLSSYSCRKRLSRSAISLRRKSRNSAYLSAVKRRASFGTCWRPRGFPSADTSGGR